MGSILNSAEILDDAIEEILARLRTIPHVKVHEGLVDEETIVEVGPGGSFEPYIIVTFSGTSKMPKRYRSMAGARYSGEKVSIVVRVVAPSQTIGREVRKYAHNLMIGFTPKGCSEIDRALYYSTGANDSKGSPTRFSEIQSYEMSVS